MRQHTRAVPPRYGPALGRVLGAAGKVSAGGLGKARIVRDQFTGKVAAAFEDIDVFLIPV